MLNAIYSEVTCGLNCWLAEEDVCKCSCYGTNHGALMKEGANQPQRMAKIDGRLYLLFEVGAFKELWKRADSFNRLHSIYPVTINGEKKEYYTRGSEKGAGCRLKPASKNQLSWEELKGRKFEKWDKPYLLWIREDLKDKYR